EPEDELVGIEQALGIMRKHIKSDSYFGYGDAADESVHLQARIHTLLGKRRSQLETMYASSCSTVHEQLQIFSHQARTQEQATKLLAKLPVIKDLPRSAPRQFWHAWKELQALHTGVANLLPRSSNQRAHHTGSGGLSRVLGWAVGGSVLVDSALFGLFGYLSYFSNVHISDMQLFIYLVCGACAGLIIGGGMGWLWGQRGSKVAQKNAI
ncbi:MAG: hypothetical protein V3U27_09435, partial [Candidatus Tectomicrobia bacterium]